MSTAVFFWFFVTIWIVTALITNWMKSRGRIDLVHAAIEKGMVIDPEIVRSLMSPATKPKMTPRTMMVMATFIVAIAVGLGVFGQFIGRADSDALLALTGIGAAGLCSGVVLLIAAKLWQNSISKESVAA